MSGRRFFVGCGVTAAVILAIAVIGGIISYKHLTTPVALPEPTRLVDADSVGQAVLRLAPDNPWIRQMFSELSEYSTREPHTNDLFPIEVVWSAHRISPASEGHILSMSFSPRGRLFGLMTDIALWRAGRSNNGKVKRVEYDGEGITAFPGTPIPGVVFVRGSSIIWSSDLDTARRAVDLIVASDRTAASPGHTMATPPATPAASPAVVDLVPAAAGHALVGAISGENGTPARCLSLIPGGALDLPGDELGGADLTFVFDATSADVAAGEVTLRFPEATPALKIQNAATDLSRRIGALKWRRVIFEASPRVEPSQAVIAVKATGLATVYSGLLKEVVKVQKTLEKTRRGTANEEPEDPNQSSSTFQ